jgi:hypothetical protein
MTSCRRVIVLLVSTVLAVIGVTARSPQRALAASLPGPFPVTISSSTFVDPTRGTPARIGVPAQPTRTIHERIYTPVGAPEPWPTVIFAPGWNSQSSNYDPLLLTIASTGYLVVGVDFPGSSTYFPGSPFNDPSGEDIANNTIDLAVAARNLEQGALGARVNSHEVSAIGHSDGGSVVANLALNSSFLSPLFNAYVVLAGVVPFGVGGSFGPYNNAPLLAMIGTADEFGNYQPGGGGTQQVYSTAASTKILVTIAGATHLGPFIDNGSQPNDTRAAIIDFLNVIDRRQADAEAAFDSEISSDGLSAQEALSPGSPFALDESTAVGMAVTSDARGYWIAWSDGTVRAFGDAPSLGGVPATASPIVAITRSPSGRGYWLATRAGAVYAFGDAVNRGGVAAVHLNAPIVAMASDPSTGGYWLLGGDGGVFSFDAPFYGSTGNIRLAAPAVGMAATLDGRGYYFTAGDGGVFTYGDARFHGSMGGHPLNKPVVGLALDLQTGGYWLDASDGGIFSFDAPFEGSTGNVRLNRPCVAMASQPFAPGYWLIAADGGIFTFGHAGFYGSGA